jgi:hypothetical protein
MAMMAALVLLEINWFFGLWGMAVAISIGISTLFIKQHFIIDVISGFSLSILVYYVFFKSELIELLGKKQKEFYDRIYSATERVIEHRLEDMVRRIVREEIDRILKKDINNDENK